MKPFPFVYEDDQVKSLHFNSFQIQSSMKKNAPFELDLNYTRTMIGFLLFNPFPRSILIVGLGGGSLSKFCYRNFPDCAITTLEIDEGVLALRKEFDIPADDERFSIVHADGSDYISRLADSADIILVDGYDAGGLPRRLSSRRFYHSCYRALRMNGVLVANILKKDSQIGIYLDRMRAGFESRVLYVQSKHDDNTICFAIKNERIPGRTEIRARALNLAPMNRIRFRQIASNLRYRKPPGTSKG